jgi:hypothetical protein
MRLFAKAFCATAATAGFLLVGAIPAHAISEISIPIDISIPDGPVETCVTAVNDSATTAIDTPVTVDVLANDSDDCGVEIDAEVSAKFSLPMFLGTFGNGSNGTVSAVGNSLKYTPNSGFSGNDSFIYHACVLLNQQNVCDQATVSIHIPTPTTKATVLGTTLVNTTDPTVLAETLARTGYQTGPESLVGLVAIAFGGMLVGYVSLRRRLLRGRYFRR